MHGKRASRRSNINRAAIIVGETAKLLASLNYLCATPSSNAGTTSAPLLIEQQPSSACETPSKSRDLCETPSNDNYDNDFLPGSWQQLQQQPRKALRQSSTLQLESIPTPRTRRKSILNGTNRVQNYKGEHDKSSAAASVHGQAIRVRQWLTYDAASSFW